MPARRLIVDVLSLTLFGVCACVAASRCMAADAPLQKTPSDRPLSQEVRQQIDKRLQLRRRQSPAMGRSAGPCRSRPALRRRVPAGEHARARFEIAKSRFSASQCGVGLQSPGENSVGRGRAGGDFPERRVALLQLERAAGRLARRFLPAVLSASERLQNGERGGADSQSRSVQGGEGFLSPHETPQAGSKSL